MFTPKKAVSCLEIPHDIHDMPARAALSGTKCSSEIAVTRSDVNDFKKKFLSGPEICAITL
ncbi:MAG: hypothetical protein HDQ92_01915 [Desulfovibrio sp.]|nr:hypothetical protein [Desulfovibrio sp.]